MTKPFSMFRGLRAAVMLGCALSAIVSAQSYPTKTVRIIAPFAPGGSADTLGRLVAQKLGDSLKQSFVVENRAGAGGVVGSELVAKAVPDGYTLLVSGVASHAVAPAVAKVPFDPLRDFTHIALFGGPPIVLVVHPALPAMDLAEFVALAKTRTIAYGSPGAGTHGHLMGELLRETARLALVHVPYKGASQAIADLIGGHLPAASTTLTTAATQIRAGKARALAIASAQRLADYPELPTFTELGYPKLVATTWFSLSGPAGLPPEIVTRLNIEERRALALPDVRERIRAEGVLPNDMDAAAFTDFVRAELARWAPIAKLSAARND